MGTNGKRRGWGGRSMSGVSYLSTANTAVLRQPKYKLLG